MSECVIRQRPQRRVAPPLLPSDLLSIVYDKASFYIPNPFLKWNAITMKTCTGDIGCCDGFDLLRSESAAALKVGVALGQAE